MGPDVGACNRLHRRGDQENRPDVERRRGAKDETAGGSREPGAHAQLALEDRTAGVHEVVADVAFAGRGSLARQLHGAARGGQLARAIPVPERFEDVPVAVPGLEILVRIGSRRVLLEHPLGGADRLHEIRPCGLREEPHARNDVRDRRLRGRLPLVLGQHRAFDRESLGREAFFDPPVYRRERRIDVSEALNEAHGKRLIDSQLSPFGSLQHGFGDRLPLRKAGRRFERRQHPFGEGVGLCALAPRDFHAAGEAPEVLDQRDAERDGNRPQLADRQRRDRLVRVEEILERLHVGAAVGVGDERCGDRVDARVTAELSPGKVRKLPLVVRGKVLTDFADLVEDEMEIVEEPFGSRRDGLAALGPRDDRRVNHPELAVVLLEAAPHRASPPRPKAAEVGGRQSSRFGVQTLASVQLRPDRLFLPQVAPEFRASRKRHVFPVHLTAKARPDRGATRDRSGKIQS